MDANISDPRGLGSRNERSFGAGRKVLHDRQLTRERRAVPVDRTDKSPRRDVRNAGIRRARARAFGDRSPLRGRPRGDPTGSPSGPRPSPRGVAAFGLVFGQKTLTIPRLGSVNLHASLLPRYRGASPIAAAILAGDATTG